MTTLSEIARRSRVSIGTVDRVIHNRGRVAEETRRRVQRIIEEMQYTPNMMARNLSLQKTFNFGALIPLPQQDGNYWELPALGIHKAVDELKIYNVDVTYFHYDKYSEQSFQAACQRIQHNPGSLDGLVIAPVLSRISEAYIREIPDSLPFVFIDSYVPESGCLAYIGQDSYQSGVLAAKLMRLKITRGKVAAFRVLPVDYHIEDRVRGFESGFADKGEFELFIYDADRENDQLIFGRLSRQIMHDHPDIRGIFVPSACTHQVAEYLSETGRPDDIALIGYDLVENNRKFLKEGIIDFLISQRPVMQGYEGIFSLYRHVVLREPIDTKTIVPMDIITMENMAYYQG